MREHDRNAFLRDRPAELAHPRHVDAKHLAVEEEQGAQRLAMGGRGDMALVGEHDEEVLHFRHAEVAWMTHPAPANEVANPMDVGVFGS